jgi:hypothetical protein
LSTPALRLRVSPQFPINVTADAGLGASITRNTLSIRNNWEGIGKTTPPSLVNYSRLVYNETLGTYERISELTTFAGGTLTTALNEAAPVTLASAGIVNIGAANANTITITGVTAITGFDTIPAGAVRRLIFASALTLTHNAISLILPTGANITTAAGDAFVFLSLGSGNWRCMDYQLASGAALALNIPDSSITSAKIADGTITGADIATGTITAANIADGTITAAKIDPPYRTPLPTTSAGVGQFVAISPTFGGAYSLPAGGTWAYFVGQFHSDGRFLFIWSANIVAGGTGLGTPGAKIAWVGWAWRIT